MNLSRPHPSRYLIAAACLWAMAATAHLSLLRRHRPLQANQEHYHRLALRLVHRHRVDLPFDQSVLYPSFLALVYALGGERPESVRLVQSFLTGLLVLLVGLLGSRTAGPWHGAVSALLTALPPILPVVGSQLVPTIPGLVLLMTGLLALEQGLGNTGRRTRALWALMGGLLAGLAAAFQSFLVTAPLLLGLVWLRRRPQALAFLLGLAVVPLAVGGLTWARTGRFVGLTDNAGLNLYLGANPSADGTDPFFDPLQKAEVRRLTKERGRGDLDRALAARAGLFLIRCPIRSIQLLGRKLALFLDRAEPGNNERPKTLAATSPLTRHLPGTWLVMALGLAGLVWRRPRGSAALLWSSLVVGALAVTTLFFASARFRLLALPGFALFAGTLWDRPIEFSRRRKAALWAAVAALGMGLAAFGAEAWLGPTTPSGLLVNEAVISLEQGRQEEAERLLHQALERRPDDLLGRLYLARVERSEGRLCKALFQAAAAVASDPTSSAARKTLARLALETGIPETRIARFGQDATRRFTARYRSFSTQCHKPGLDLAPAQSLARACRARRRWDRSTHADWNASTSRYDKGGLTP